MISWVLFKIIWANLKKVNNQIQEFNFWLNRFDFSVVIRWKIIIYTCIFYWILVLALSRRVIIFEILWGIILNFHGFFFFYGDEICLASFNNSQKIDRSFIVDDVVLNDGKEAVKKKTCPFFVMPCVWAGGGCI